MKLLLFSVAILSFFVAGCNSNETASSASSHKDSSTVLNKQERNKQIIMQANEAFIKGDAEALLKISTPDCVSYNDGSMPPVRGLDSMKASLKKWMAIIKDYRGDNLHAFASGDSVLILGDWSGTFTTDFMGMKLAGKSFKVVNVDIYELTDDGKIKSIRGVQSINTMINQALGKK